MKDATKIDQGNYGKDKKGKEPKHVLSISIGEELHTMIQKLAKQQDMKLSPFVCMVLKGYVDAWITANEK